MVLHNLNQPVVSFKATAENRSETNLSALAALTFNYYFLPYYLAELPPRCSLSIYRLFQKVKQKIKLTLILLRWTTLSAAVSITYCHLRPCDTPRNQSFMAINLLSNPKLFLSGVFIYHDAATIPNTLFQTQEHNTHACAQALSTETRVIGRTHTSLHNR